MAKGAVAKTSTAVPSGSVKQIGQAFDLEGQMLNPRPVRLLRFVPLSTLCRQPRECQRMARGHRGCDEAPNGAPPDGAGNSLIIAAVELDERKGSSGRSRLTNNSLRPWPDGYETCLIGPSEGWIPVPTAAPVGFTTPFSNLQTFGFRAKLRGRLRDRLGNCARRKSPFSLSAGQSLSIAWDFADFFPSFIRLFNNRSFEMLAL